MFKWLEKKAKNMKWYEFSLLKLSVFFFTLFLITVWPAFSDLIMGIAWYWYLIIAIILSLPLMKRFFT